MKQFTIEEVKELLKDMHTYHPCVSEWSEKDLTIDYDYLRYNDLTKIATLLGTDKIDDTRKGCDTCGYGRCLVIYSILKPPPKWYIRKSSKLEIKNKPYGGESCKKANVEPYEIYEKLENAKNDAEKLNSVNQNSKVSYLVVDYYTNEIVE